MVRPENQDFDREAISELTTRGHTVEFVDTAAMTERERYEIYLHEAVGAAGNRYRVGRPFGSNAHKGEDLGAHVPALLVSPAPGEPPADVYPHEERDGRIVTIAAYLGGLDG
jgi:hypothetical protein